MELKLARSELNGEPKSISLQEIEEAVKREGNKIFYFDRENSHKDLMNLVDYFEERGYSVYFREVRYGLDENDYIYEVHILQ
ncbi:MAG: hypothetical protein GXO19_03700 [Epsilonproteobacteria bacterium]|nr:hypothetical protein [Campylobacterota bacterium]NPA56824.1 hypothetical protein [Campylobacterota bacterium]